MASWESVSISETWTWPHRKMSIRCLWLTSWWMLQPNIKFYPSWMGIQGIIRSILPRKTFPKWHFGVQELLELLNGHMPFGLKNAGATYQRAMNSIFHDMIGWFMKVYIDDVVIKSLAKCKHLVNLEKAFQRMRSHNLKMNPLKCTFGVSARNILGFLVH